jgi:hypothetical protein
VGRRSSRRARRAQKKQSRADQVAKPPLTRKHRVLLGLALPATALAFGALTWIGMAIFLGATASREVWANVERTSWIAALIALGLTVWGPRHRKPARPAIDRRPLLWFGGAAVAGIVIGGLVSSIPPNPPSLEAFGKTYPNVWRAEVVDTYRTDPNGGHPVNVGVRSYHGPYTSPQDREQLGSHFAGDSVYVVCRVDDGRTIRDGTTGQPSNGWYRLNDNSYLPDLFVDAPAGVPTCADHDRQE